VDSILVDLATSDTPLLVTGDKKGTPAKTQFDRAASIKVAEGRVERSLSRIQSMATEDAHKSLCLSRRRITN
jgi:hypothetical protein